MEEKDISRYRALLKEDNDLVEYLIDKSNSTRWYYERFLYFLNCAGDSCKYADACIKLMKEDIDEFYRGREASNVT
jgi:hypothetical protein